MCGRKRPVADDSPGPGSKERMLITELMCSYIGLDVVATLDAPQTGSFRIFSDRNSSEPDL